MSKTKTDNVKASPELTHALDVLMKPTPAKPVRAKDNPYYVALSVILSCIEDARESIAAMERNPLAGDEHAIKLMRQDCAAKLRALADEIERGE